MTASLINKIILGDCLSVMKGLPDKCIDLVLTDPPYGVDFQSNRRIEKFDKIENDDNLDWLFEWYQELYRVLKDGGLAFVWYGWVNADKFMGYAKEAGFAPKSHFIWLKNNIGLGWFTRAQHEPCYLFLKGKRPKPDASISDVIPAFHHSQDETIHPTQKPLELFKQQLTPYIKQGIVLDPFSGSGTTALACHDLGLDFICIEKDADYHAASVKRLENHQRQLKLL